MALQAGADFAVVTDANFGLLTSAERPPRAGRSGAQHGLFLGKDIRKVSPGYGWVKTL